MAEQPGKRPQALKRLRVVWVRQRSSGGSGEQAAILEAGTERRSEFLR
jgi:hypothetical protein